MSFLSGDRGDFTLLVQPLTHAIYLDYVVMAPLLDAGKMVETVRNSNADDNTSRNTIRLVLSTFCSSCLLLSKTRTILSPIFIAVHSASTNDCRMCELW